MNDQQPTKSIYNFLGRDLYRLVPLQDNFSLVKNSESQVVDPSSIGSGVFSNNLNIQQNVIQGGKDLFDNSQSGFILGANQGTYKFFIGNTTNYLNWDGSSLTITGTIQTGTTNQRIVISNVNNYIQFYDSNNNLVATLGGSISGGGQYLDLDSPTTVDNQISRIIANNTTGTSAAYVIDTKGYQVAASLQNDNTNVFRTTNSVPLLDLRQLGTGSGIRFANNSPNSDGKVFDITQNLATSTEAIFKVSQNGVVSTNFRKIFNETNTGFTLWISNGTTPNGNLSGQVGDFCLNGASGHSFWLSTAPSTWTQI